MLPKYMKKFLACVGRDVLSLATSILVAESWLGASDFSGDEHVRLDFTSEKIIVHLDLWILHI